jgi:hemerythrin-like domain-containing protein
MTSATSATPLDTTDMVMVHRVFRRELRLLPDLVRAAAGDAPRAKLVGTHALELLGFLHHHHHGEDELVWPKLRERVALEVELIARMEAQHEAVAVLVVELERDLPGWSLSADAEAGERLATTLEKLAQDLVAHLDEEERSILPLVAQTFTPAEWGELGERGFATVPKKRRLITLGHILEDASAQEQREFLAHVPAPARIAWKVLGRKQFAKETAALRLPAQR